MNTQLNVKTILFQTVQFSMSIKLNGPHVLLCITNNSIKYQLFYTVKYKNNSISNSSV